MSEPSSRYSDRLAKIKLGQLPKEAVKKERKPIARKSAKKLAAEKADKENGTDEAMDKWFSSKMLLSLKECENCGLSLRNYDEIAWMGSQHHVLEKSLYPSVKTHPDNHLVLGRWCCHPQWHTSWQNAAKMKIFPKAISIIKILYPLLTREEKSKLPEIVIQEIPPELYSR